MIMRFFRYYKHLMDLDFYIHYKHHIDPDCIVSFSSNLFFFNILKYEIVLFYSFINLNS